MYSIIQNLNTHTFEQKKEEHVFLKKKKKNNNKFPFFFWPHARRSKLFQKRMGKFCCSGDLYTKFHLNRSNGSRVINSYTSQTDRQTRRVKTWTSLRSMNKDNFKINYS